ncbi:hypothetical protein MIDIC_470014 [Alphaproteobacteria bacterium]
MWALKRGFSVSIITNNKGAKYASRYRIDTPYRIKRPEISRCYHMG